MYSLHNSKRHLFLEENDSKNNSFILAVNNLQDIKDEIYLLAGRVNDIITVATNIDSINTVKDNLPYIQGLYDIKDYLPTLATHIDTFTGIYSNLENIGIISDNIDVIIDFQNLKAYLPTITTYGSKISTVAQNIDAINNISDNISVISGVNSRIADVKSFNDNINNGTVSEFIQTFIDAFDESSNRWAIHIRQIGQSIITSAGAHNWEATTTITQNIPANTEIILPDLMQYKPETFMLIVSYNGTLLYLDDGYEEVGDYSAWSTRIKFKFPLRVGDKVCFRTIGISCNEDSEGNLWVQQLTTTGANSVADVETARLSALRDIESSRSSMLQAISTLGSESIQNIQNTKTTSINDITTLYNTSIADITALSNERYNRIETIGNSIAATISASSAFYLYEINTAVATDTVITLPNELKYKVGTFMLLLSYNGSICYENYQYQELGTANEWSTTIRIKFDLRVGDKLGFRIIAFRDFTDLVTAVNEYASKTDSLYAAVNGLVSSVENIMTILNNEEETQEPNP